MKRHLGLPVVLIVAVLAAAPAVQARSGHWEFSGHYGLWTLNVLKGPAADLLSDAIDTHLRDKILESVNEVFPDFGSPAYEQTLAFDSSGHDFGASVRWYPAGHYGSFSLGVSVEKSLFEILPTAAVRMDLQDPGSGQTGVFNGTAAGTARIDALSFLLSFRWDIFPTAAIHPYFTFGGGISTTKTLDDSNLAYTYTGLVTGSGLLDTAVAGGETKTLRELRDEAMDDEESDLPMPNFLPFVELNLGLKVRLTKMVHVFADAGVFDGFIARAGLAIRL
jgi:hypothetical protein